jgi:hypothetical protein
VLRGSSSAGVDVGSVGICAAASGPIPCTTLVEAMGKRQDWFRTACTRLQQAAAEQCIDGDFNGALLHICSRGNSCTLPLTILCGLARLSTASHKGVRIGGLAQAKATPGQIHGPSAHRRPAAAWCRELVPDDRRGLLGALSAGAANSFVPVVARCKHAARGPWLGLGRAVRCRRRHWRWR